MAGGEAEQVAGVVGDVRLDELAQLDRGRPFGAQERPGRLAAALLTADVDEAVLTGEGDVEEVAQVLEAAELRHARSMTGLAGSQERA